MNPLVILQTLLTLIMTFLRKPAAEEDEIDDADIPAAPSAPSPALPLPADVPPSPVFRPEALAPLVIDETGWAQGEKVVHIPSKRTQRQADGKPVILLWHWTATKHGTAKTMVKATRELPKPGERSNSVHFWVESDGTIYQSVSCLRGSWHAGGKSSAVFIKRDGRWLIDATRKSNLSVNALSIGVELVNVGEVRPVKRQPDGSWKEVKAIEDGAVFMGWPFGRRDKETGKVRLGPIVKPDEVQTATDRDRKVRWYHLYTPEQIEAAERLTRAVIDAYGLDRTACSWGHIDVDPTRKADPGPLWYRTNLPLILERVFGKRG